MNTLNEKNKYFNLTYYFKAESNPIGFNDFNRLLGFMRRIKEGSIDLEKAEENKKNWIKSKWNKKKKMGVWIR